MASAGAGRGRKAEGKTGRRGREGAFVPFHRHITDEAGRAFFVILREEESAQPQAGRGVEGGVVTSETLARRMLELAFESDRVPDFVRPDVGAATTDFVSLGVETEISTNTKFVKFRQHVNGIPVYGSLVVVELDAEYKPVSLNSNFAAPKGCPRLARVSPLQAAKAIARRAGYYDDPPPVTPALHYYLSREGAWHLAYVIQHVRLRPPPPGRRAHKDHEIALAFDYVVDAMDGAVVAELPRTVTLAETREAADAQGRKRRFSAMRGGDGALVLRDPELNVETYDAHFSDPRVLGADPPKGPVAEPWLKDAVSAHANASVVATYLRDVLGRSGIDNRGGRLVSVVRCVTHTNAEDDHEWQNACWDGARMLYGQVRHEDELYSYAANIDIVAHELFHGVIGATARLEYEGETGALNESYCDVFAILISNWNRDRRRWDWRLGEDLYNNCDAQRSFRDPEKYDQPKTMRDYRHLNDEEDKGGVHWNSGIHNYAAYRIMAAKDADGDYLFEPADLAAMFYVAMTQHLSRQATFADSRRAVLLATRSRFRALPPKYLRQRVKAVEQGFAAAGIR